MRKKVLMMMLGLLVAIGGMAAEIDWILVKKSDAKLQKEKFAVEYDFKIMKFEVTVDRYCEFLNAVAKMDTLGLFDKRMRIARTGSPVKFVYKPKDGYAKHPVSFINFFRAARFANWLHNGKPSGRGGKGLTEDGAYDMKGDLETHSKDAKFWIPTEKEWCKVAYYDPEKSVKNEKPFYWDFGDKTLYSKSRYPKFEAPPGGAHSANCSKALKETTPVGAYTSAVSAYGLFDINGNVFEWTETNRGKGGKNIRGSAWNHSGSYMLISTRTGARLKEVAAGYGFRLAAKAK